MAACVIVAQVSAKEGRMQRLGFFPQGSTGEDHRADWDLSMYRSSPLYPNINYCMSFTEPMRATPCFRLIWLRSVVRKWSVSQLVGPPSSYEPLPQ